MYYLQAVGLNGSSGPQDAGEEGGAGGIVAGRIDEWYEETTPTTSPYSYEKAARGGSDGGASCRAAQVLQT